MVPMNVMSGYDLASRLWSIASGQTAISSAARRANLLPATILANRNVARQVAMPKRAEGSLRKNSDLPANFIVTLVVKKKNGG